MQRCSTHGETGNEYKTATEDLKGRDHLEDRDRWRIILKWIIKENI
jgi:hypothetical protein